MKGLRGVLVVLVLFGLMAALCIGPIGAWLYTREVNPVRREAMQLDVAQQAWQYQFDRQRVMADQMRWEPFWNTVATSVAAVTPVVVVVLLTVLVVGLILLALRGLSYIQARNEADRLLVRPDPQTGHIPIFRGHIEAGLTLPAAMEAALITAQANRDERGKLTTGVDWKAVAQSNVRSLHFKDGNEHNRLTTAGRPLSAVPTSAAALTAPGTGRIWHLEDLGNPPAHIPFPLPWGIGEMGETVWTPLNGRHRLVGGTTQSGKTQLLQSQLDWLIQHLTLDQIRFFLIDPKHTGLVPFWRVPHTLDFGTDVPAWTRLLRFLDEERDRRQQMFKAEGIGPWHPDMVDPSNQPLPFLYLVIDELADVLTDHESHRLLLRVCSMGASAGVGVTGATQFPSVEYVTQDLKTNMRDRACGAVPDFNSSRVILDRSGAEDIVPDSYRFLGNWETPSPVFQPVHAGYLPVPTLVTPAPRPSSVVVEPNQEDILLDALRAGPLTRTEVYNLYGNSILQDDLDRMVRLLVEEGRVVEFERQGGRGRPAQMVKLA